MNHILVDWVSDLEDALYALSDVRRELDSRSLQKTMDVAIDTMEDVVYSMEREAKKGGGSVFGDR